MTRLEIELAEIRATQDNIVDMLKQLERKITMRRRSDNDEVAAMFRGGEPSNSGFKPKSLRIGAEA